MLNCLFVGIGGFFGCILRYLAGLLPVRTGGFPLVTLVINIVGAFALGLFSALVLKRPSVSPQLSLMLRTGLCGGFTTFSTFAFECTSLMESGKTGLAVLYAAASLILGCLASFAGQKII